MVGNGTLAYDHDQDGRTTDQGGCQAAVRNVDYDTFVLVRYMKNTLTVITQGKGSHIFFLFSRQVCFSKYLFIVFVP